MCRPNGTGIQDVKIRCRKNSISLDLLHSLHTLAATKVTTGFNAYVIWEVIDHGTELHRFVSYNERLLDCDKSAMEIKRAALTCQQ
jgi:hypothetical protein